MITITQFTLPQLRIAHDVLSAHKPAPLAQAPKQDATSGQEQAGDQAEPKAEDTSTEATSDSAEPQASEAPAAPAGPSAELVAALMDKLSLADTKVPYILGALKAAGSRVQKVRQVRVVQLEGAPSNAVKSDEAAYILDMLPEPARKGGSKNDGPSGDRKGARGGKGGKGRGNDNKKPGDRRGPPGAGRGPGAGGDRNQGGRGPGGPGGAAGKRG